jgi:signal peptidase II
MKTRLKIFLFCFLSLVFIGCDQVTKGLAKNHLTEGATNSYLHDTFRLIYVQNTGAAMSLGDDLPPRLGFLLLGILPLIILSGLFFYSMKHVRTISPIKLLSICLIFGGGIGNIFDRLMYNRHVTDFMNIGVGNIRTGIFNFADVCVTTGVILFLIFRKESTMERS